MPVVEAQTVSRKSRRFRPAYLAPIMLLTVVLALLIPAAHAVVAPMGRYTLFGFWGDDLDQEVLPLPFPDIVNAEPGVHFWSLISPEVSGHGWVFRFGELHWALLHLE